MDSLDFTSADNLLAYADYTDSRANTYPPSSLIPSNWPFDLESLDQDPTMAQHMMQNQQHQQQDHNNQTSQQQQQQQHQDYLPNQSRRNQAQALSHPTPPTLQTTALGLGYAQNMTHNNGASLLNPEWHFSYPPTSHAFAGNLDTAYGQSIQTSPVDYMPVTAAGLQHSLAMASAVQPNAFMTMAGPMDSMNALAYPLNDYQNEMMFHMGLHSNVDHTTADYVQSSLPGSSPTGSYLEIRSLSSSDNGWTAVDYPISRHNVEYPAATNAVFNPGQTLHIRSTSDTSSYDDGSSAQLSGSYEEIPFPLYSPVSEGYHAADYLHHDMSHSHHVSDYEHDSNCGHSHEHSPVSSSPAVSPVPVAASTSTALVVHSPNSSSASSPISPPTRRRKSPTNPSTKNTKAVIKKATSPTAKKDGVTEKRVGRRRGPLRPDQRQSASEIRKLRACLRCKFLKKTCDTGDICGGCKPSHARLWQVPCTRIDIKDIGFFMKDWKADYERHISLGFSIGNIKGFSQTERLLYVTHGYGHYLPINAREIYVRDDTCFSMDWSEKITDPQQFEVPTAKLSAGMEGVSTSLLSEYLDRHLEKGFDFFVDNFFEGTPFLTEMLKTAHRYWKSSKSQVIRKALKLVVAYNLTLHVTMVEGLTEEEAMTGKIEDEESKYYGKTMAPVMINFQVKCALADMWRELQKEILEELSSLYSSVYSGEKLKNWPTIFMLAAILLAVWEEMQFDAHYRTPDEIAVNKFCNDMETTPVGVIVGLFQAISQKLPSFLEWDTRKHHHLLNSNQPICDALTEVKDHVTKHGESSQNKFHVYFTNRLQKNTCVADQPMPNLIATTSTACQTSSFQDL